ncbi:MAG: MBL fold metallo-hydrolase [Candidatus Methylacidiphilales bacterium]
MKLKPKLKKRMIIFIAILLGLSTSGYIFLEQKQFGQLPTGNRLERVKKSPNFRDGAFQNQHFTPDLAEGTSYFDILKAYLNKTKLSEPKQNIPSIKTNLLALDSSKTQIIWFGHSSYFIKTNGLNILIDPVFSGNASPVSFFAKNYDGANEYNVDDFPELDMVIITHDHYDHLDYKTIDKLKHKTKHFYTSLGVGAHLNSWGITDDKISEFDWWDSLKISDDIQLIATPARHFSGRKFKRNQTLWASYILKTPTENIFLGGDSGFDTHFKEIGNKYGPFDMALLECGQYNKMWGYIHMMPEQVVQAAIDLNTKVLMPVHWSKFTLALHPWNEPIKQVTTIAKQNNIKTTTPLIGQPVIINQNYPDSIWWDFE